MGKPLKTKFVSENKIQIATLREENQGHFVVVSNFCLTEIVRY